MNSRNDWTNNRPEKADIPFGANSAPPSAGGVPARALRTLSVVTGAALCMCLGACMVPYDGYGGGSATFTTYQPGYRVQTLPAGYRSEVISGTTYYYQSGNYYRRSSGGYVVIDAPRGSRYYDDYGRIRQGRQLDRRYDRQAYDRHDQRYERGDVLTRLPAGHRVVNHRGKQYYQVGERYYIRENNAYSVVSRPY